MAFAKLTKRSFSDTVAIMQISTNAVLTPFPAVSPLQGAWMFRTTTRKTAKEQRAFSLFFR
jgi:hypothetical protein